MSVGTIPSDFVLLLQAQLTALQAGDREALDLPLLADEFESVVGRYRYAVREHAEIIIGILQRPYWIYGDWTELAKRALNTTTSRQGWEVLGEHQYPLHDVFLLGLIGYSLS